MNFWDIGTPNLWLFLFESGALTDPASPAGLFSFLGRKPDGNAEMFIR
jgi:hypothetical protein